MAQMTTAGVEIIRARVCGTKNIFIHNDLSNIAYYYRNLIIKRTAKGDNKGITFDHMSCLMFSAFSFEAYLNFFGLKLVTNWEQDKMESRRFRDKSELIFDALQLSYDWNKEPYKSVDELKNFRNTIAHGKPKVTSYDRIVEVPQNEIERRYELTAEWEALCKHDSTLNIYENVEKVILLMRAASGIEPYEMLTNGTGSVEVEPNAFQAC